MHEWVGSSRNRDIMSDHSALLLLNVAMGRSGEMNGIKNGTASARIDIGVRLSEI